MEFTTEELELILNKLRETPLHFDNVEETTQILKVIRKLRRLLSNPNEFEGGEWSWDNYSLHLLS